MVAGLRRTISTTTTSPIRNRVISGPKTTLTIVAPVLPRRSMVYPRGAPGAECFRSVCTEQRFGSHHSEEIGRSYDSSHSCCRGQAIVDSTWTVAKKGGRDHRRQPRIGQRDCRGSRPTIRRVAILMTKKICHKGPSARAPLAVAWCTCRAGFAAFADQGQKAPALPPPLRLRPDLGARPGGLLERLPPA